MFCGWLFSGVCVYGFVLIGLVFVLGVCVRFGLLYCGLVVGFRFPLGMVWVWM